MNTELKSANPYELGISAAWLEKQHPEVTELGRSAASSASEYERGLADGRSGIGFVRHRDRTEYVHAGRTP